MLHTLVTGHWSLVMVMVTGHGQWSMVNGRMMNDEWIEWMNGERGGSVG